MKRRAFTLIELLVVMGIMVALIGLTVSGVASSMRRAKKEKARADVMNILTAVNAYYADTGLWPPNIRKATIGVPLTRKVVYGLAGAPGPFVFGPYLEFKDDVAQGGQFLKDPWLVNYRYAYPDEDYNPVGAPGGGNTRVGEGFAVVSSAAGVGHPEIGSWE